MIFFEEKKRVTYYVQSSRFVFKSKPLVFWFRGGGRRAQEGGGEGFLGNCACKLVLFRLIFRPLGKEVSYFIKMLSSNYKSFSSTALENGY
jgi:hypothetical protein